MNENLSDDEIQQIRNLPLISENAAYSPKAMINCQGCSRINPPNRLNCIYCGRDLDLAGVERESINLTLRAAEAWEPGHNVVLLPTTNADITAVPGIVGLDGQTLDDILDAGEALPILRLASQREAEVTERRVAECGVSVRVISDESLDADNLPRRLRGIEFTDDKYLDLITFNGNERVRFAADEILLIVTGMILKSETATRAKRKKGSFKTIDETSTSSDMSVIDIYTRDDARGYRAITTGFDFSSLGDKMTATASSNVRLLTEKLENSSRAARVVSSYSKVRRLLEPTWPAGRSKNFLGVQRGASAGAGFSSVETSDNVEQFTKFSRMHFHLL